VRGDVAFSVYKIWLEEVFLQNKVVTLRLNQQQLELLDRTVSRGAAADRPSLIRLALRELAAKRRAEEMKP
jgi:Arc/MetJ-type ribon-helix-helix transcriptional regulator